MTNFLIALGCSFTYGEGLSYELVSEKYKKTYDYIKSMDNHKHIYDFMFDVSVQYKEFDEYRIKNNYPTLLKKLLNVELYTNGENGGANIDRMYDLNRLMGFLNKEPELAPKYCVFQITHSGRDMQAIINPNANQSTRDLLLNVYGEKFYNKVNENDMNKKSLWGLDNLIDEANHIFIEKLIEKFNVLEKKYGTKCLFYMGLGEHYVIKTSYNKYSSYPYFFELEHDNVIYYTQLQMINELNWTLDGSIGVKDSHPNKFAHKWLADKIYNKFLQ
jgi:hypothetical protein